MKTIKIANADIPIKFGMFVLGTFLRERKLKLSDLSLLGEDLLLALELASQPCWAVQLALLDNSAR